ncbi:MAG TPA: FAD-linked oxidase C-terminal domain-containing protein, partial [Sphingobacteriaceae bacterium]|nr:FAD-linked oxidase C-terminal domain-containing protein [Sphingobacteriaceae bacterium]
LFEYLCLALPPSQVPGFRREALTILSRRDMRILEFGLWASREFVSIAFDSPDGDPGKDEDRVHLADTTAAIIDLAHGMGGSMEFCHGAGLKLAPWMAAERRAGLEVLRTIKQALDPRGIMNPGKLGL